MLYKQENDLSDVHKSRQETVDTLTSQLAEQSSLGEALFSLFCDNPDGAGSNDCSLLCLSDKGTKSPGNSSSHVVQGKRLRIDEANPSVNNI